MTIQERMNTINGDGKHAYTFQEAVNKNLKAIGTHNSVDYSSISLIRYTAQEGLNIIYKSASNHLYTSQEVLNLMAGNSSTYTETAREALNTIETGSAFTSAIPS
tara:strand:+ start:97 stop:411 length:315 start_codon:yes stop_codon:yes gene_type:complete